MIRRHNSSIALNDKTCASSDISLDEDRGGCNAFNHTLLAGGYVCRRGRALTISESSCGQTQQVPEHSPSNIGEYKAKSLPFLESCVKQDFGASSRATAGISKQIPA